MLAVHWIISQKSTGARQLQKYRLIHCTIEYRYCSVVVIYITSHQQNPTLAISQEDNRRVCKRENAENNSLETALILFRSYRGWEKIEKRQRGTLMSTNFCVHRKGNPNTLQHFLTKTVLFHNVIFWSFFNVISMPQQICGELLKISSIFSSDTHFTSLHFGWHWLQQTRHEHGTMSTVWAFESDSDAVNDCRWLK